MASIKNHLIGKQFSDFQKCISDTKLENPIIPVNGQRARLIPTNKASAQRNEMNLTSVFLSTLVLVKEFKDMFSREIGLSRAGTLHAYTEVEFPKLKLYLGNREKKIDRVDGLLLVVASGKIKDAVIFEMKSDDNSIKKEQVERYMELANELGINKLVTISNQFVTSPKYSPIDVRIPKNINLFHFSWHYVNTLGKILWEDNEFNIVDEDQRRIMYEVTEFFDYDDSGVKNYDKTSNTWSKAISSFGKGTVNTKDPYYSDAVLSWIQEERDIALKLSQLLGYVVDTQKKAYSSLQERIDKETQTFITPPHILSSEFKIKNAISNMTIAANAYSKMIVASVVVQNPEGKRVSSQLNFVKRQLEGKCAKSAPEKYRGIRDKITLDIIFKGRIKDYSFSFTEYEEKEIDITNIVKEKNIDIKQIRVNYVLNYSKEFSNRKNFITKYESQILNFYHVIVQNLTNGEVITPQIKIMDIEE
ncbi:MAG: hypothetical protein K9M84_11370 [Spirochaetia bacterium]|nr:hypothetical protein [Spirochaetia bacterium]